MKIEAKETDHIAILSISGNLALEEVLELKKQITPYLESDQIAALIFDLSQVNHIDSSGIMLIVSIFKALQKKDKRLILAAARKRHRDVFDLTKLDRILPIATDTTDALSFLKPRAVAP